MTEAKNTQSPQAFGGAPNFNDLELGVLKFWEDGKIFEKSLEKTKEGEPFIFYDGPPFATGLPHYGSILPSVIKDAIPRYQTMKGRYVRRRWGWDCHGLPIENLVEKNLKISGKKQIEEIGVERFNKVCRDNVLNLSHEWGKMIKRVARWVEFENSYKTMDTTYMESVWWGLKQLWEKQLIYEDRKILLYCSRCETPISNFEVAMDNSYKDVTEESVFVKFKILPRQRIVNDLTDNNTYALAWTTTPWTLPGNTSLNIGPDIKYVLVEQNGEKYLLAKDLLSILEGEYEIIGEYTARSLESLEYEPLFPGVIPNESGRAHHIYLADFVTTTDGTGIVHNAAMYGEEDYQLAKAKNLPRVDMLDHKGQYLNEARIPENLREVFFKDAEKIVIEDLKSKNLLYKSVHFTHSYPHCYRCATPLFYNALPAWFINIQKVKDQLIANNQTVNWYPEHLKLGRFQQGIANAPDWNISRNRYWATALPFWKCENKECRNIECVGSVAELIQKSINFEEVYKDIDLGYKIEDIRSKNLTSYMLNVTLLDLHKPYIDQVKLKCEKCASEMQRIPEVVDCWVESGSMPFAELHAPFENQELFDNRFPADFVVEYIPQTRAWFYVMHVLSSIIFGQAPFKNVMTTGTILAEDGSKMSKSKNNYPDPNLVIEKFGADALRFYLLASPVVVGEDLNFSEKGVSEVSRKVNMLFYNVWTFWRMYEKSIIEGKQLTASGMEHVLDKWILSKLSHLHAEVSKNLDVYNTAKAGREIVSFINDLSTWYVRRSRERIKQGGEDAKNALAVLGFVLAETAKILAPFMPFLADFIFKDVTGKESVHLENWSVMEPVDENILVHMQTVRELVETGLAMRKEQELKVRQPLLEVEYFLKGEKNVLPEELEKVLAEELNVKKASGRSDFVPKSGWIMRDSPVFKFALNVEITPELKQEGLAREIERQAQDLRKKSGLKVGELVDMYYNTQSEDLENALLKHFDRKKTFVSQIQKSLEVEVDFETQNEIEGKALWLGMIKI
jgi:isoleucyl-tRNA synthetase